MDQSIHMKTLVVGPIATCCYVLWRDGEEGCVVIDPGGESKRILAACNGREVKAILLTHGHFDHIAAVDEVAGENTRIVIGEEDAPLLRDGWLNASSGMLGNEITCRKADVCMKDDEVFTVCGMDFRCVHTPGHTRGSSCYCLEDAIFTGDTIFMGGYGRTDLPGGSMEDLRQSLNKLAPMLKDHTIYPGH